MGVDEWFNVQIIAAFVLKVHTAVSGILRRDEEAMLFPLLKQYNSYNNERQAPYSGQENIQNPTQALIWKIHKY